MNKFNQAGKGIAEYLLHYQQPDGSLLDEFTGKTSPLDHYAHTFFALSALQLFESTKEEKWLKAATKALDFYLEIPAPKRGHLEFNNFALLLCYQILIKQKMRSGLEGRLLEEIKSMKFSVGPGRGSINWVALGAAARRLRFDILRDPVSLAEGRELMEYVLSMQLPDGFFIDHINDPGKEDFAVHLAYQAKTCLMLLVYFRLTKDERCLEAAVKGLQALSHFIAPDGEAFYFGRSNNALFGFVCGIQAFELAASLLQKTDARQAGEFSFFAEKLYNFIRPWQQADGHFSIMPNDFEAERVGWDYYMFNTVYNAFAGALFLMIEQNRQAFAVQEKLFYAEDTGLLAVHENDFFAALSLQGQVPKGQFGVSSSLRNQGLNLLALKTRGFDLMTLPFTSKSLNAGVNPKFNGFKAFARINGVNFSARTFESVQLEQGKGWLAVSGQGRLSSCRALMQPLRFTVKVVQQLQKQPNHPFLCQELEAVLQRKIIMVPEYSLVLFVDEFSGLPDNAKICFLSSRLSDPDYKLEENGIVQEFGGRQMVAEKVYPLGLSEPEAIKVETSKGYALILNELQEFNGQNLGITALYVKGKREPLELAFDEGQRLLKVKGKGKEFEFKL